MAKSEHLKILKQGTEEWNEWRRHFPNIIPDLSREDFRDALLYGDEFLGINLAGANLARANLSRAWLINADLSGASLSGSNLELTELTYASLVGAYLDDVIFKQTFLRGVDFNHAIMGGTVFSNVALHKTKNLGRVEHVMPSSLGTEVLSLSRGKIPEVFLRGCGVPESLIVMIPALVKAMQPIQYYSCFISYSSKDEKFAQRLHAGLQSKGVRCWYASENLKIGDKIRVGIDESIRVHDKLLLILSKHSIESEWVEKEVETAMERERQQKRTILFPIRLDDTVLKVESGWAADVRRSRNIGDFQRWKNHDTYSKAFERLLRDLKASA
jgi:hypothetical protein